MAQRRWLIATGGAVLIGMLLCGAFALGVYVGKYGFTGQGLTYGPNAPPQPGAAGAAPQPDLVGLVRRVSFDSFELATREGPRWVEIDPSAQFLDERGAPLTRSDLRVGDLVAVFGDLNPAEGRLFLAQRIIRLPPRAQDPP
jgi:hypothetical protein